MSNILLTGATGFLGGHLLRALLADTTHSVVLAKRSTSRIQGLADCLADPRVQCFDVEPDRVNQIFTENKIDLILHCATEYGRNGDSLGNVLEANLILPIRLLEKAVQHGVRGFINVDSYFNKENMSYSHLLNYALSKKSFLFWLKSFSKNIHVTNIVLEHIFGEGDRQDKFVESMIRKIALEGVDHVDLTPGDQKRDFIYVDDAVQAFLTIIDHSLRCDYRFKSFEVGTGIQTTIRAFLESLKRIVGSDVRLNFGALSYREDEILSSCADIMELSSLGWTPKFSVEQGIKKVIEYYQSRGET